MKVCTDACILGAYASRLVSPLPLSTCLDIGTGTGLLSLMLAQDSSLIIDAIDIDAVAVEEATENFRSSPWQDRLNIIQCNITSYVSQIKYDLIITNPPFFENDLTSPQQLKNIAKHAGSLTLNNLIEVIDVNLSATGYFIILLPFHRLEEFEQMSKSMNFSLHQKLLVRHSLKHGYFRGILFFGRMWAALIEDELVIRNENGYTNEFISLLKNYYLHL